jgi:hypothetical protein
VYYSGSLSTLHDHVLRIANGRPASCLLYYHFLVLDAVPLERCDASFVFAAWWRANDVKLHHEVLRFPQGKIVLESPSVMMTRYTSSVTRRISPICTCNLGFVDILCRSAPNILMG